MKIFLLLPLLAGMAFLLSGSAPQEEPYAGDIIVFTKCRAVYNPVRILENNKQYFVDKRIRILIDSSEYNCGYLLVRNNQTYKIDIENAEDELIARCENFFFHHRTCGTRPY